MFVKTFCELLFILSMKLAKTKQNLHPYQYICITSLSKPCCFCVEQLYYYIAQTQLVSCSCCSAVFLNRKGVPPRQTSRNFHGCGSPYMLYNMESCLTMAIESHTLVKCQTKFLNAAWQLQATIKYPLLNQRKIVTLLSGYPNGNTQLLNLGTMSFNHTKWGRVSV